MLTVSDYPWAQSVACHNLRGAPWYLHACDMPGGEVGEGCASEQVGALKRSNQKNPWCFGDRETNTEVPRWESRVGTVGM